VAIFSPLLAGPSAVPSGLGVDWLLYAHFENVEFLAPVCPQMGNKERVRSNRTKVVNETGENQGPITQGLKAVGTIANLAGRVPLLAEVAGPVEWVANFLSGVTSFLGWSKPRELNGVTVVSDQITRYAGTYDGPDLAVPGGMSCLNRVETIDYASYTDEDEMSMAYLLNIPFYWGEIIWATGNPQGYGLFLDNPSPIEFRTGPFTDTVSTASASFVYNTPTSLIASMFAYWRGPIIVTFKFIKTQMHSGRLQFTFTPNISNTITSPDLNTSSYSLRAIVDIRTQDEISFELPYLALSDYLSTHKGVGDESILGELQVLVLNELKGPESVSQSIAIQIFYRAGPGFEFAVPSYATAGMFAYVPQMGSTERIMHGLDTGNELPQTVIGNANSTHEMVTHAARCVGEKLVSIKQLLLRNNVINGINNSWQFDGTHDQYVIDPNFIAASRMLPVTGDITAPVIGYDLYSLFANMYAYRRGGVRWMHQATPGSTSLESRIFTAIIPNTSTSTGTRLGGSQPIADFVAQDFPNVEYTPNIGVAPPTVSPPVAHTFYPTQPMNTLTAGKMGYNHVPYYNRFPISLNCYYDGTSVPANEKSCPDGYLVVQDYNSMKDVVIQRSVADDFQFSFFIGAPPTILTYDPPT